MNTRELLIASTQELLWERGYVGTSPKAILQHSGVGQGSLYHHFTGKAELAREAISRSAENLRAQAATQLSVPGTAVDKVVAFLDRERDVLRGCQVGRLALDPEIFSNEELRQLLGDAFTSVHELLVGVLAKGVAQGEVRKDLDVHEIADLILATLQGGYVLSRAANSDDPFGKAIRGLQKLLRAAALPVA
ncbi:TetR/AcrR family transcriptional regulator [Paraburkholderia bannensis]|uniref:TetR/AcrR family transcriptional regulator n=1 Tax=Paraburkholderia bannensis TaxID=765414 RepID=UPI002ABE371A|nr:TetR/AcrR family transcriptional regulator [Paraburkholderia bannensis]